MIVFHVFLLTHISDNGSFSLLYICFYIFWLSQKFLLLSVRCYFIWQCLKTKLLGQHKKNTKKKSKKKDNHFDMHTYTVIN